MSTPEERARARATWPGRVADLRHEGDSDDLSSSTTPEERVLMVDFLTRQAWAVSGLPVPQYSRREMPGRVVGREP
jgi:hypothetical protein